MPSQANKDSAHHDSVITTDLDFTADLADPPPPTSTTTFTRPAPASSSFKQQAPRVTNAAIGTSAPQPRLPVAPGRVLCDRYVLSALIGTGGTCAVFRARDLEAGDSNDKPAFVALKTPRPDYPDPARALERLRREFSHAKRLAHAGIIDVFDLACDDEVWFMTMELLEGESLAAIMRRQQRVPAHTIRRVLRGTADALAYAHVAGIAHGDVNPANIFVGRGDRVKLLDFGTACSDTQMPAAAAALAYASPQVLEHERPQISDDVFSFACIAYELVTGSHPFDQLAATIARAEALQPKIPPEISPSQTQALMAALSWEPQARPTDIKAFAATIAPDAPRIRAQVEPEIAPPQASSHDHQRWLMLAGVCIVAMVAAVILTRLN